jgi:hypothetical protein
MRPATHAMTDRRHRLPLSNTFRESTAAERGPAAMKTSSDRCSDRAQYRGLPAKRHFAIDEPLSIADT